jgi:hypothetical protein
VTDGRGINADQIKDATTIRALEAARNIRRQMRLTSLATSSTIFYLQVTGHLHSADHSKHICTTNLIKSTFATVRHRTGRTRGCLSRKTGLTITFKLMMVSVRCAPPNGCVSGVLVSTIDSGHLGALYGGKAEEAALAG